MKSSELRIGNQIKYHDKIITVAGVVRNTIYYESKTLCFDSNIGDYTPFRYILLTEEWLLKSGFVKKNSTWFVKGNFAVNISFDVEWGGNWLGVRLKYIHQLQNLYFDLTSNELMFN